MSFLYLYILPFSNSKPVEVDSTTSIDFVSNLDEYIPCLNKVSSSKGQGVHALSPAQTAKIILWMGVIIRIEPLP